MRVAITGGTGFVGGHLAKALVECGHEVVVIARGIDQRNIATNIAALPTVSVVRAGVDDLDALVEAFSGCDAVAHCAGINREIGRQTYDKVHVSGTANVVDAARRANVKRLALLSVLRARPFPASGYHDTKWQAEEIVRDSGLDWTILKPGMIFGKGDHMLDHLSHALHTFPVFVGIGKRRVRPVAVEDVVRVLIAAVTTDQLVHKTVPVLGPNEMTFDDSVRLVARVVGRHPVFVRAPLVFHTLLAIVAERTMHVPLASRAQVQILREEVTEPLLAPDSLPDHLVPATRFDVTSIENGLPEPRAFGLADLRFGGHTR